MERDRIKRLVICCDGTWNRPDDKNVTNVEKIARTVQNDLSRTGGIEQLTLYLSGVGGAGYHTDRILGGAFGFGLFSNVLAGYRYLALNYEPGDEIYIFGFSRGAYTARSLAGMIAAVGLLTREALVHEKLPLAVARYKARNNKATDFGDSNEEFRRDHCHAEAPVHFLGVFDTVGALGVPGAVRRSHQFHDVTLGPTVRTARQALAIDENRMKFEPCLWEVAPGDEERVKQVWFEGVHSDVGGGYADSGLSDTALLWMVSEAARQGLIFDEALLQTYLASGKPAVRHDADRPLYKAIDATIRARQLLGRLRGAAESRAGRDKRPVFVDGWRNLDRPDCAGVRIAEPAARHFLAGEGYRPPNVEAWARTCDDFADCQEPVIALPEPSYEVLVEELRERGISLSAIPTHDAPERGTTVDDDQGAAGADPAASGPDIPAARSPESASERVT